MTERFQPLSWALYHESSRIVLFLPIFFKLESNRIEGRVKAMKITDARVVSVSDQHSEDMGFTFEERRRVRVQHRTQSRLPVLQGFPQMTIDRVSISQDKDTVFQSRYSFSVTARSEVFSGSAGEMVSHEQKAAMERLVGGVMDQEVIISHIKTKKDPAFLKAKAKDGLSDTLENKGASFQTGILPGGADLSAWEMSVKTTGISFEKENVTFQSKGEVTTEDGRVIRFSLDMSLDRAFVSRTQENIWIRHWQERVNLTDPLVISLDGKAPQLTDAVFEFDLNNDGFKENINSLASGSGFLAFDKNHDHVINDGSELFGPGTGMGFEELKTFDEDQNSWIDENDGVFSQLSVWTKDADGQDRLISLKEAGIGAISLQSGATGFDLTKADNALQGRLKNSGVFLFENGKAGLVQEMDLVSQPVQQESTDKKAAVPPVSDGPAPGPAIVFPAQPMTRQKGVFESKNPLQELLDQIKKLKEEMARLYEQAGYSPAAPRKKNTRPGLGVDEILDPGMPRFFYDSRQLSGYNI